MAKVEDAEGNLWFKQERHEFRMNHGIRGAHMAIPFQCEDCWMLNLEGRLPVSKLDDTLVMLIRRTIWMLLRDVLNLQLKAMLRR